MTKRCVFPGIVDEIGRYTSYASLLVGEVEIRVPVPTEVIRHYDLSVGNTFDLDYPKRGEITVKNIRPHKETKRDLEETMKNVAALFSRAQTTRKPTR